MGTSCLSLQASVSCANGSRRNLSDPSCSSPILIATSILWMRWCLDSPKALHSPFVGPFDYRLKTVASCLVKITEKEEKDFVVVIAKTKKKREEEFARAWEIAWLFRATSRHNKKGKKFFFLSFVAFPPRLFTFLLGTSLFLDISYSAQFQHPICGRRRYGGPEPMWLTTSRLPFFLSCILFFY